MMKESRPNYFKTQDGEQIFYTTNFDWKQDGPHDDVLIFNYGLVCSNHHWSKQLGYFDEKGYKILIHDYRGHYLSSGVEKLEDITFANISGDLKQLCDSLNIKTSILLGHSMGVNVCLEFAKRYPEMVKQMILISGTVVPVFNIMFNTNLTDQLNPVAVKMLKRFPKIFANFWKYGGWNPLMRKAIHIGGFNVKTVSEEFIEIYLNRLGQLGPELFFHLIEQMHKHDILSYLQKIKTPTLIIGGDQDKVIPNYLQKLLLREMPKAKLYLVRNGSHVPQVDFPEFINERIDLYLEKCL